MISALNIKAPLIKLKYVRLPFAAGTDVTRHPNPENSANVSHFYETAKNGKNKNQWPQFFDRQAFSALRRLRAARANARSPPLPAGRKDKAALHARPQPLTINH